MIMMKPTYILSLILLSTSVFLSPVVQAQEVAQTTGTPAPTSAAEDTKPWLYQGSDIPVDSSWTFGVLPNGLKYAVKKNEVPKGQVAIRVRIDAGSLHENDDERGYAHLIEHLSFRGSTYVADGESKRIWQRFGVSFGSDSNAATTPTETVYKLDLPNSTPEKFGESMKILSGMMRAPNFTPQAVEAERAIVLAERRESASSAQVMRDALFAHIFQGQALANRAPIGTVETLQAATTDKLKAFHQRWYRPEKTVISIAGDAEPAVLEASIKEYFGNWSVSGAATQQPDFGKPAATDTLAKNYVDANLPPDITMAWVRSWEQVDDTIAYNEQMIVDQLAVQIINRRLENAARSGAPFLLAEVNQQDVSRSADITMISIKPVGEDWETAIREVRAIISDAVKTPPSPLDVERERRLFDIHFQTSVDKYSFEAAAAQADSIVSAVDIRETIAGPATALDIFRKLSPRITPEWILQSTQRLLSDGVGRIFMTLPKADAGTEKRLATAFAADTTVNNRARLSQRDLAFKDLPVLGKPVVPISRGKAPLADMEAMQFPNGTRVLLHPNKGEVGQVRVMVRFGRGYQAASADKSSLLWTGPFLLNSNGVATFKQTEIDLLTAGRRIQLDFVIDDNAFALSATTSTADLPDQLKLLATKLEQPGWDPEPVKRLSGFIKSDYDASQMSAGSVLSRDLLYMIRGNDLRWKQPSPADASAITPQKVKAFWQPLLKSGPVEVILIGDFDTETAVTALSQTFGAMKARSAAPISPAAASIAFPVSNMTAKTLTHKGPKDQAAASIAWPTGGGIERIQESRELDILANIFSDRLFEKFRSEQAASYSPSMSSSWPEEFDSGGYLVALSQVDPKDVDRFFDFASEVAADLAANPVSEDELKRAVEPTKQMIERAASGNIFWLNNLKGASYDPRKYDALRYILFDYTGVTPARIQELAQKYLVANKAWKLQVLPEGK